MVKPWFDMPPEVAAMQPEVLGEDAVRTADGMDTDQKEVLTVRAPASRSDACPGPSCWCK